MKKTLLILLATVSGAIIIVSCISPRQHYGVEGRFKNAILQTVIPSDAKSISAHKARFSNAVFLDTRSREEYNVSHLQGSFFTGYKNPDLSVIQRLPKDTTIIAYCSIGKRSGEVALILRKAGYLQVYNLYGGIFEWVNKGYPIVNTQNKPTDSIHAYNRLAGLWLSKGKKVY